MGERTYKIATLGCRTNQYESQAYIDQLEKRGFRKVQEGESADLCIVNTCTVTASADAKSLYQIRKLHREYTPKKFVVTGCFAEKGKRELQALFPEIEIISNREKETLLQEIFPQEEWPEFKIEHFEAHTRAFVKIQDGCNSYCSYCIIPFVRGRSVSRKVSEITEEVQGLIEKGYREIVLTGINIGDFDGGTTPPTSLASLVRILDEIPGLARLRLSSIDPDEVDEDLREAIVYGKHTCPSMHIVLQAGSNLTLKRMRRKYTRQDFLHTVSELQKKNNRFTFTTDVIFGFPGEGEEDFAETLKVIEEVQFVKVHFFPYSDRPKTRASRMEDKVPPPIMKKRKEALSEVAKRAAHQKRESYVGKSLEALIEKKVDGTENLFFGHSDNFLPIYIEGQKGMRQNDLIRVHCTRNQEQGLKGGIK